MRRVTSLCFLCVVISWGGLIDDGSVPQQDGVIGRNVYWHTAYEMGNVSVDYLKRWRFIYGQNWQMFATIRVPWNILLLYDTAVYGTLKQPTQPCHPWPLLVIRWSTPKPATCNSQRIRPLWVNLLSVFSQKLKTAESYPHQSRGILLIYDENQQL